MMEHEKLSQALDEVRDEHITEAAKPKKKTRTWIIRLSAVAAAVALVITALLLPKPVTATAVSLPEDCRGNGSYKIVDATNEALFDFYTRGTQQFISGEENGIWSPVNAFIGLAMVAELTEGESRQQILDLFGVEDLDTLRSYVSNAWEYAYRDGNEICTLANSLWLDKELSYNQEAMDNLAYYYYASVYKGKMGSSTMNTAISNWINNNTGGLLKKAADNIRLSEDTVLALYSTIYLRGTWYDEFNKSNNTQDTFRSYSGDMTVTYMNQQEMETYYYWADNFSAVSMSMKNGTKMWFILPDEGYTVADVLASGEYMQMVTGDWENYGYYKVNISVPKFDITGSQNLKEGLENLGVTDVFDANSADFSAIYDGTVYLTAANQSVRVIVDEEGVKAAAYIEIPGANSAEPPEDIVDFVVDRPFVFVLSKGDLPLFIGTVTDP